MIIAAFVTFALLVGAWVVLPSPTAAGGIELEEAQLEEAKLAA